MPVRRRKPVSQTTLPYTIPNQENNENFLRYPRHTSKSYRRQQRQRHSSWTIQEDVVKQFIPTSISEHGYHRGLADNYEGSCISMCGLFESNSDTNCPEYQTKESAKRSESKTRTVPSKMPESVPRSRCYSMPVDVPLRKNAGKAKKSKKGRSSGGYFFDKYMKRFRAKRSPSLGSDGLKSPEEKQEAVPGDFEMKEVCDVAKNLLKNFRSNRQDMVITESQDANHKLQYQDVDRKYQYNDSDMYGDGVFADDANDDLYPIRYGTSTKWGSHPANPSVPAIRNEDYPAIPPSYSNSSITIQVTATPLSPPPPSSVFPPLFWGDATHGPREGYLPTSPVPSMSDCFESNCCYSDSNSVTLKAMETLYLCNFRVSVDGEWLCLKELEHGYDVSKAIMAYDVSGMYFQCQGFVYHH